MIRPNVGWLAISLFALAGSAFGQHAAHQHGKAQLNIAIETDQELIVELFVPADAVFGFEHEPTNDAERKAQADGLRRLEQGLAEALVFKSSLGCRFETLESASGRDEEENHSDGHSHDEHEHDDHGDHHDEDEDHGHSDVQVQWSVTCQRSISGSTAEFDWTDLLAGIEEIDVIILSAERQDELRLRGHSGSLQF